MSRQVYQLYPPKVDPKAEYHVDIILLHGLQLGDYTTAWQTTWECTEDEEVKCWPADFLSQDLPNARVLSVSYDSSGFKSPRTGNKDLTTLGQQIFTALTQDHVGVGHRPLVLVGHSMGGLALKEVCVWAVGRARNETLPYKREAAQRFVDNVKGMAFYATPHTGSLLASMAKVAPKSVNLIKKLVPDGSVMKYLELQSQDTARLNQRFHEHQEEKKWKMLAFYETQEMAEVGPRASIMY